MKKISKIMALLLVVVMVFTGCVTEETTYRIDATGKKVTINSKIEFDKTKFLTVIKKSDPTLKTDVEADKAFREMMKEMYGTADGYACSVSTTKKDDVEYYVVSIRISQTIEQYNAENASTGTEFISTDTFYAFNNSAVTMDSETMAMYSEMGITKDDIKSVKITTTVEFPNKIVSHKNGIISETNPNSITFKYDLNSSVVLFATTNSKVTVASVKKEIKEKYEIQYFKRVKKPSIKSIKVTSVKNKKGTAKIKIKKVKNAAYEIQYSTNKKFKKSKIKKTKKATVNIKKLKAGKRYYFRVRAVAIPRDNYVYENDTSKYSKKKSVVIKKKK